MKLPVLPLVLALTGPVHGGLVHEWRCNESSGTVLEDSIGTQDAEIVVLAGGGSHGFTGGAIRLDGGTRAEADYIRIPDAVFDGLSEVTLEFWATPQSFQNYGRVFEIGPGTENPDDNILRLAFSTGTNGNQPYIGLKPLANFTASLSTAAGSLHHYVVVWSTVNGGRIDWYRDGAVVAGFDTGGRTIATLAGLPQTEFILGRSHFTTDSTANATFHAVRLYDQPLSQAAISALAGAGPEGQGFELPVAVADAVALHPGGAVALAVLANDTSPVIDPGSVEIVAPASVGSTTVRADGRIHYVHSGPGTADAFSYTVKDVFGNVSAPAVVTVNVEAGTRIPAPILAMPSQPPAVAISAVDAFPGLTFEDALCIRHAPGETQRVFIGERRGRISYVPDIEAAVPERKVLLDITAKVSYDDTNEGELGLMSFALHPDFAENGYLYVFYTAPGSPYFDRVSRFTLNKDGNGDPILVDPVAQSSSELILISQVDEVFNHNAGDIHFGPDGFLYISMGDEGDQMNQRLNSQRIDKDLFSAVLRIDVDKESGIEPNAHVAIPTDSGVARFSIPADNPFRAASGWNGTFNGSAIPDLTKVRTEFWAVGFRSPWRMSFDSETGDLWVGDVGQYTWEEVTLVKKGENHGWAFREGFQQTPNTPSTYITAPPAGFTHVNPVWDYPHSGGSAPANFSGNSVTGGVVYHGTRIPTLTGAYIFADFRSGNIWSLRRNPSAPATVVRLTGDAGIAGIGTDPSNGDVLFADYSEGKIKRLVRRDVGGSGFPATLSATGAFADLATLTPNPGVIGYEPNVPFWSDHAIKKRWFAIPGTTDSVGFSAEGNWSFPAGMLWVKHFDLETERGNPATKKRLETRVLVRNPGGSYGVSYRWNEAGTEATLVPDAGVSFEVPVTVNGVTADQTWEIPSRGACMLCHTVPGGHALSFNTRQMNRVATMMGETGNQIELLRSAGYLSGPESPLVYTPPHAVADDDSTTLEFRVRSYLATNCVQCHQPGGAAPSTWDARPEITLEETGLINGIAERPSDDPLDRLIVPGDLQHSVLLQRIQAGNGFSRMPPLGSHVLDQGAIDLVTAWITTELPGRLLYDGWRTTHFAAGDPAGARAVDADGDGLSNYEEFLRGSPPLSGGDPWQASLLHGEEGWRIRHLRKAHRGYLVEASDNLVDWSLWDDPENVLRYSEEDEWVELPLGEGEAAARFFRFQITEP